LIPVRQTFFLIEKIVAERNIVRGLKTPSNLIPVRQTFFLIEKIVAERNCKGIEINKNSNSLYRIGPVDKADAIRPRVDGCKFIS